MPLCLLVAANLHFSLHTTAPRVFRNPLFPSYGVPETAFLKIPKKRALSELARRRTLRPRAKMDPPKPQHCCLGDIEELPGVPIVSTDGSGGASHGVEYHEFERDEIKRYKEWG
eukprot:1234964-Amorphochlora_amoeboformis.AAC.1